MDSMRFATVTRDGVEVKLVFFDDGTVSAATTSQTDYIWYGDWFLRLGQPGTWFVSRETATERLINRVVKKALHKGRKAAKQYRHYRDLSEKYGAK